MRALWIAVSTLALANLIALGAFAFWLKTSGRLNAERVEKVRQIFQPTIAQDTAAAASEKAKAELAAKEAEVVARDKRPPITAEQRLAIIREHDDEQRQKNERLQRETQDLLNQLDIRRAEFENDRKAFIAERDAFRAMRDQLAKAESDQQLAKTLKVYEALKPADAAAMMETMMSDTDPAGTNQVVAYLNRMQPRTSSRIVAEFKKKDPVLAADLLERLRTFGFDPRTPRDASAPPSPDSPNDAKPAASNRGLPPDRIAPA